MLFYMLALVAYLRSKGANGKSFIWLSALLYCIAIFAKPLMITLPLALILYDMTIGKKRYPPCALKGILMRKLPYLVPLAALGLATAVLDPHNEMRAAYHGGGPSATFRAMTIVLGDYLRMLLFPVGLSPLYLVRIPMSFMKAPCLLSLAAIIAIAALAVRFRRERPLFSFCVFWAGASLLPVLQIVPVNVIKADRYLYLPTAALCLLFGGIFHSDAMRRWRFQCAASFMIVLVAFTLLTISQNAVWHDSVSLWEMVLMRDPANADAYNNLGIACAEAGDYAGAEALFKQALALRPYYPSASNNLANLYRVTGRYEEALKELQKAMDLTTDIVYSASAYMNMGLVYEAQGRYAEALEFFEKAARINPVYLDDSTLREHIDGCRSLIEP